MFLYPNAKINIGLRVLEKRSDGYHNIETIFYPIPVFDILEIVEGGGLTINSEIGMRQYGIDCGCNPCDNLSLKAYKIFRDKFDLPPVEIYLHKNIPSGAGLGGGSSDAAFTLIGLNELFNLNLSKEELAVYASQIGSDCAFFIYNTPMVGTKRGEELTPINIDNMRDYYIKVVYPPFHISTAEAYKNVKPRNTRTDCTKTKPLSELIKRPIEEWKDLITNDFEESVFLVKPELIKYKEALYQEGAVYASMSGTGSTMFGIFKK